MNQNWQRSGNFCQFWFIQIWMLLICGAGAIDKIHHHRLVSIQNRSEVYFFPVLINEDDVGKFVFLYSTLISCAFGMGRDGRQNPSHEQEQQEGEDRWELYFHLSPLAFKFSSLLFWRCRYCRCGWGAGLGGRCRFELQQLYFKRQGGAR